MTWMPSGYGCAGRAGVRDLWRAVISRLEEAEERTAKNDRMTLCMCVNYGGRAEIADAARALAEDVAAWTDGTQECLREMLARYLDEPEMPDVDLFIRTSGEQRISNFLLWQSAYAELMFTDTRWPEFDRLQLWEACLAYARRERRFGSADVSPDSEG